MKRIMQRGWAAKTGAITGVVAMATTHGCGNGSSPPGSVVDSGTHADSTTGDATGEAASTTDSGGGDTRDATSTTDGSASDTSTGDTSASVDSGASDSGSADALPTGTALIRVHYPAGTHALTLRGSAGGLNWTTGQATTASGDTYSYSLTGVTTAVEWKPLLDDTTWAIGPNFHVASGESVEVWPHFSATTGQVKTLIAAFHSTVLSDDRAIYVYLPPSYDENTDATYPVVYMHDGQNLWAALPSLAFGATWNVDTAFDTASNLGACSSGGVIGWGAQPLGAAATTCTGDGDCASKECRTFPEAIVIGIANDANRIDEYTPTVDPTQTSLGAAGGADQYLQMIVQELKPTIDGMLRTRPDVASTTMAGSSLGGLVTAYAGLKHPDVFGRVAEISPSTWWDSNVIVTDVNATPAAPGRPLVIYVDSGAGTVDDEADTDLLAAAYLALGYVDGTSFRHVIQSGASHSETYWAQRFPGAMQFVLGARR
ncbi:MAG: alpha/beta hydrolase-fold protein [Polyangiales bacterium]